MNAPTPAQAAARRLQLAPLDRRTHEWQPEKKSSNAWREASMSDAKASRARALEEKGMTRREVSNTIGVSRSLLRRYLGPAK